MPGVVVAGTHSGCGKTTVTLGLLAALMKKGMKVQAFKTGPDFIDSGLHRMITGRPSRNLDLWMCGKDYVISCYQRNSGHTDIAVIEGVMGLYDGQFSTASLALSLVLPVVLVVDAYGMAETAGAIIKGIRDWGSDICKKNDLEPTMPDLLFAGVVFNRVSSERHYNRLRDSLRGVPVLGYLPRDLNFEIPHRYLGLTVAEEEPMARENIDKLADVVLKNIDVERIIAYSGDSSGLGQPLRKSAIQPLHPDPQSPITIAVAYDKAFCFYYEDNLDLLRDSGARIVFFSPLSDSMLPDEADAVYIGGGYPEIYSRQLSQNATMLTSVREWAESGKPLYAECGGLMYLSGGIHDFDGNFFAMAGVLPFETRMKKERAALGYREISLKEDCVFGEKGGILRGHEFHYSEIVNVGGERDLSLQAWYSLLNGAGDKGFRFRNTYGSYIHLHFGSNPDAARNFVNSVKERKWKI